MEKLVVQSTLLNTEMIQGCPVDKDKMFKAAIVPVRSEVDALENEELTATGAEVPRLEAYEARKDEQCPESRTGDDEAGNTENTDYFSFFL